MNRKKNYDKINSERQYSIRRRQDPWSDWTLDDLNNELDILSLKYRATGQTADDDAKQEVHQSNVTESTETASLFPRRKGGFRMALDSDSEDADASEVSDLESTDEEPEVVRSASTAHKDESVNFSRSTLEEAALEELETARIAEAKETVRQRQQKLRDELLEIAAAGRKALEGVKRDELERREWLRQADLEEQKAISQARESRLFSVRRQFMAQTEVGELKLQREAAEAEEARRQQQKAKEEAETRARAKAEEIARKKAAEEEEAARRRKKAEEEEAEAQRALQERRKAQEILAQQAAANSSATPGSPGRGSSQTNFKGPRARASLKALEAQEKRAEIWRDVEEKAQAILSNEALKKDRKALERKMTLHIQQISATQEQIRRKTSDLLQLLTNPGMPHHFLGYTLANKLISQCESQVQQLPSFAFPLAQVIVDTAVQVPLLMDVVIARLNQVCIYTVPKYFVFSKSEFPDEANYFSFIGYKIIDGALESTDAYVARMASYVTLLAAIVQTKASNGNNPFGIKEGWAWCSRLLNKLPPNRFTASALDAFLKMAGHSLHKEYPRPFMKLLATIHNDFFTKLRESNDPDARAVYNKLETYIVGQNYSRIPDGRNFPVTDESARIRA